jgi:hypothetical protein
MKVQIPHFPLKMPIKAFQLPLLQDIRKGGSWGGGGGGGGGKGYQLSWPFVRIVKTLGVSQCL